jgi:D-serine dehydratase
MRVAEIEATLLDHRVKGIPGGTPPFPLGEVGSRGWNVLREDLPLPLAVLRESAMEHNRRWMRRFLARSGAVLAPHGKTTMSPQLFRRQLEDGAWAITIATPHQLQVCREHGVRRVLMANQVVGRQAVRYLLDELAADPELDFYGLVDSVEGAALLAGAAREAAVGRPVQLLLEGGYAGGRAGCRDLECALRVARAVRESAPWLELRGVEGFEGLMSGSSPGEVREEVSRFLDFLVEITARCEEEGLFAPGELILTAGGSAFYDLVVERFARAGLHREVRVVTRSGCYLTHDSQMYRDAFRELLERSPEARELGEGLRPALEVWAYVQSRPEPGRAILTMGKRDCSHDGGLPVPLAWFRPAEHPAPRPLGPGHAVTHMNDQHAFLELPGDSPLRVGDLVASGVSHPCTTFDKWQLLFVVNDGYDVVSAIRTFF